MITPAVRRTAEAIIELLDELSGAIGTALDMELDTVERVRDHLAMLTRPERRAIRDMLRGVFRDDVLPSDDEIDAAKTSKNDQRN